MKMKKNIKIIIVVIFLGFLISKHLKLWFCFLSNLKDKVDVMGMVMIRKNNN